MVYRIYVEKKKEFANEALSVCADLKSVISGVKNFDIRVLNRYDVENIDKSLFDSCVSTVFSEPRIDNVYFELPQTDGFVFATEYLPGQYDQRADSAEQCIQIVSKGERPVVRSAKVYIVTGDITSQDVEKIKKYVINPVESREASLAEKDTLFVAAEKLGKVKTLEGFIDADSTQLKAYIDTYGLAMDFADISLVREYFKRENRNPTLTEIRLLDTYWSDHCRHTTFLTTIDNAEFKADTAEKRAYEDYLEKRRELGRTKPVNLMDIATFGARYLKAKGLLRDLDESEEINACTVKISVDVDGSNEDWLLLFKNETHNHPTEIEPFGGAATCIGGCIRDPLSGRSYVYQAMRVTGAANPLIPLAETIKGKLPQKKIVTTAAAGYSSYGNQIGLATGTVDEVYHPGYAAKRMEIGAVVGAAKAENVRRETPLDGDIVILLGGKTGRDGCGGATGSSKSHNTASLEKCGAEVQKGNAPEERKLQRLMRNGEATRMIKRCNDFGAGGVSVAIGELADGLKIDLNAVPKKYEGLDGTELAISESQERMAVVIEANDEARFKQIAKEENLEATVVARVTAAPRLVMEWNGDIIVDISREFLNSNGAVKNVNVRVSSGVPYKAEITGASLEEKLINVAADLNVCSKRGLAERFDSTIGAGSVLMPYGGKNQLTPAQAMAAKIPAPGKTESCSVMSWGYNPYITEKSPYAGAYLAVVESLSKLVATGADNKNAYLTFQEYFEKLGTNADKWGNPLSALLGALKAQLDFEVASIGGKDSMSGSFEDIHVPPTLVSFAVAMCKTGDVISPEFKKCGSRVVWISPEYDENNLPLPESQKTVFETVKRLIKDKKAISAYTPVFGGAAEGIIKMCMGNRIGIALDSAFDTSRLFGHAYGSFLLELTEDVDIGVNVGTTCTEYALTGAQYADLDKVTESYENKLEPVFECNIKQENTEIKKYEYNAVSHASASIKIAKPRVLIPVFPGTNCEYDTARAFENAGAEAEIFVIRNLKASYVAESVEVFAALLAKAQILFIPGGFSGGDEPDGSGKFITAFLRSPQIKHETDKLLARDGLIGGICNGFQALIKLGLVPYGEIRMPDASMPTLTYNIIGRHQSKLVRTRIASNKSPWLMNCNVGDIHTVPISHGEGRFICDAALLDKLEKNGQIGAQYVDLSGNPTMNVRFNPNGSYMAIECITSPDGRVIGKMGHSERKGNDLYKNVCGCSGFEKLDNTMFDGAVKYFKG